MTWSARSRRREVVYLITSSLSATLLRGQLSRVRDAGWDVLVGTGLDGASGGAFDPGTEVVDLGFVRPIRPLDDVRALVRTIALLARRRPSHVNVSTPKAAVLGMLAAFLCRVPERIYVVRGLRYETMDGSERRLHRSIERLTMRAATEVVFNSASLRRLAHRDGLLPSSRGRVLAGGSGNGIDVERFSTKGSSDGWSAGDGPTLGFVGRLTRDKGVADLVEAFLEVSEAIPTARLLVVGDLEDDDRVNEDAQASVREHPRIVHRAWTTDVAPLYRTMDVLVFPSYREGLPNVPLEAQASGVPVVGYAATGTVDAVAHGVTGHLVPLGDRGALTRALVDLLEDPARLERLSSSGPTWVAERFGREAVWGDLLDVYGPVGGASSAAT